MFMFLQNGLFNRVRQWWLLVSRERKWLDKLYSPVYHMTSLPSNRWSRTTLVVVDRCLALLTDQKLWFWTNEYFMLLWIVYDAFYRTTPFRDDYDVVVICLSVCLSVNVSVRPLLSGIVPKRLNMLTDIFTAYLSFTFAFYQPLVLLRWWLMSGQFRRNQQ